MQGAQNATMQGAYEGRLGAQNCSDERLGDQNRNDLGPKCRHRQDIMQTVDIGADDTLVDSGNNEPSIYDDDLKFRSLSSLEVDDVIEASPKRRHRQGSLETNRICPGDCIEGCIAESIQQERSIGILGTAKISGAGRGAVSPEPHATSTSDTPFAHLSSDTCADA